MPRPISFTLAASPRISSWSLAWPSTVKNSSRRHCRLPKNTGKARMASRVRPAMTSGEIASASSGTEGCSFNVRVITFMSAA